MDAALARGSRAPPVARPCCRWPWLPGRHGRRRGHSAPATGGGITIPHSAATRRPGRDRSGQLGGVDKRGTKLSGILLGRGARIAKSTTPAQFVDPPGNADHRLTESRAGRIVKIWPQFEALDIGITESHTSCDSLQNFAERGGALTFELRPRPPPLDAHTAALLPGADDGGSLVAGGSGRRSSGIIAVDKCGMPLCGVSDDLLHLTVDITVEYVELSLTEKAHLPGRLHYSLRNGRPFRTTTAADNDVDLIPGREGPRLSDSFEQSCNRIQLVTPVSVRNVSHGAITVWIRVGIVIHRITGDPGVVPDLGRVDRPDELACVTGNGPRTARGGPVIVILGIGDTRAQVVHYALCGARVVRAEPVIRKMLRAALDEIRRGVYPPGRRVESRLKGAQTLALGLSEDLGEDSAPFKRRRVLTRVGGHSGVATQDGLQGGVSGERRRRSQSSPPRGALTTGRPDHVP